MKAEKNYTLLSYYQSRHAMKEQQKKFYVTTPIYYVTARPHLGSLYSTLLADVAARWHALRGFKTFFLTGTDEHGQKVAQAAENAHKKPQEFVDSFIQDFKDMWSSYEIQYDYFIRTTDESHKKAVQFWLKKLIDSGEIYKSYYSGFYCTPCETYVTEKDEKNVSEPSKASPSEQSPSQEPLCISCARKTSFISEESYFFRLSAYQDRLLKFYEENPDFIVPSERLNEVVKFVQSGLKDLSISRTSLEWGIPFPDDPQHVTYVWADALNNYVTAIGYGNEARQEELALWWPADMQILGKDILRFHAVYWPAFLMASGLALPKKLLVHGWITVNDQKMSKSFGNVVDPQSLLDAYGAEAVRYYLIRHMAITQDSDFSTLDLEKRVNSDLAHDLGNLLNRVVTLSHKQNLFEVKSPATWCVKEIALRDSFWTMMELFIEDMNEGYWYRALSTFWRFIHEVNSYFHAAEPWKISDTARFEEVISATCHSLQGIAFLLSPVMPQKMKTLLSSLGVVMTPGHDVVDELSTNPWTKTFMLTKIPLLFEKYEIAPVVEEKKVEAAEPTITIEEWAKTVLAVGTIQECEEVPRSDKLLKLLVNFGSYGTRQILSGVKKSFSPADLIGRQAIFVLNLAPRKMMGLESNGMLLTVQDAQSDLVLLCPTVPVPDGTRLK